MISLGRRQLVRGATAVGVAAALPGGLSACATTQAPVALGTIVDGGAQPLVLDARGLTWRLSPLEGRVDVLDADGVLVRAITDLAHPRTVAIDARGRGWIVEVGAGRLSRVDLDRDLVTQHGEGTLTGPRDVALDSEGHVVVADALRHTLVRLDDEGAVRDELGVPVSAHPDDALALNGPRSLALDVDGTWLVAEVGAGRVSRRASDGAWLEDVVTELPAPRMVRIATADGRAAIADVVRGEVLVVRQGVLLATHRVTRMPESIAFAPDGALWISGRDAA